MKIAACYKQSTFIWMTGPVICFTQMCLSSLMIWHLSVNQENTKMLQMTKLLMLWISKKNKTNPTDPLPKTSEIHINFFFYLITWFKIMHAKHLGINWAKIAFHLNPNTCLTGFCLEIYIEILCINKKKKAEKAIRKGIVILLLVKRCELLNWCWANMTVWLVSYHCHR